MESEKAEAVKGSDVGRQRTEGKRQESRRSNDVQVRPHECGFYGQYSSNHPSPSPKLTVSSVIVDYLQTLRGN